MLIRYGYEITINCNQPTPIACMMSVQADRLQDLIAPEAASTTPYVPMTTYHDMYGNLCRRLVAPAGDLTLHGDATIRDGGELDPVFPEADQSPVDALPNEMLVYLLGSRYCETDRLSRAAWDLFGHVPPGWARVQAISTSSTATSGSTTSRPARRARPSRRSRRRSASAAISRISPLLCAAA